MGVVDKFLSAIRVNEDDYYDDDEYYDEEDEAESKSTRSRSEERKVTPMRQNRPRNISAGMEVVIVKPASVDDCTEITDILLSNRIVNLNLEGIDVAVAQRIIDFISGSAYAMRGNLKKISNYIFLVTPSAVDVSGDVPDVGESSGIGGSPVNKII